MTLGKAKWVAVNEYGRRIGSSHPRSKLTEDQVDEIRDRHEDSGESAASLARAFGVSRRTIRDILNYTRRAQTIAGWKKVKE
jgi:DNA invertase Pin-like site-specific DNA recombinase